MKLAKLGARTPLSIVVLIAASVVLIAASLAIGMPTRSAGAATALSDEQARKLLMAALAKIGSARCEDNKPCEPATAEEKENPPITLAEARIVIRRGALSAIAENCGLDWRERNFTPMMAYWRQTKEKNARQMALIALLHGITQAAIMQRAKKECSGQRRQDVDKQLTFQP